MSLGRTGAKIFFALVVFVTLLAAILTRPDKRLTDFDQSFYLTIAYDLTRHHVFSNGVFDDVDSTITAPPPGMFFSPLYPWLLTAVMKIDPRFAATVACTIEANEKKRELSTCEIYARPMQFIHALLLALGVLAIARAGELITDDARVFYGSALLATVALALEADLFSYLMTESLWFSLYSLVILAVVMALKGARIRDFLTAGAILGLLCLARPSFLVLAPVLVGVILAYGRWFTSRRRGWLVRAASFVVASAVMIAPWLARNYLVVGKLGLTEEYGSATLIERFAFNDMTLREGVLAFPSCIPLVGPAVVGRLFGPETMRRFQWNEPGSFFDVGRGSRMALTETHGRLDPIIGDVVRRELAENGWRHLLTTLPLAWCGLWVSSWWSLLVTPLFAWGCVEAARRSRPLLLAYAVPALLLVGFHAAIANHYPRYNLGLIGPLSVGAAWMLSRRFSASTRDALAPSRQ